MKISLRSRCCGADGVSQKEVKNSEFCNPARRTRLCTTMLLEEKLTGWAAQGVKRAFINKSSHSSFHKRDFLSRLSAAERRDERAAMSKSAQALDELLFEEDESFAHDGDASSSTSLVMIEELEAVEELFWKKPGFHRSLKQIWTSMTDADVECDMPGERLDRRTFQKLLALVQRPEIKGKEHTQQQQQGWLAAFHAIDIDDVGFVSQEQVARFIARRKRMRKARAVPAAPVHTHELVVSQDRGLLIVARDSGLSEHEAGAERKRQLRSSGGTHASASSASTSASAPSAHSKVGRRNAVQAQDQTISSDAAASLADLQARVDAHLLHKRRLEASLDAMDKLTRSGAALSSLFALVHAVAPQLFECDRACLWLLRHKADAQQGGGGGALGGGESDGEAGDGEKQEEEEEEEEEESSEGDGREMAPHKRHRRLELYCWSDEAAASAANQSFVSRSMRRRGPRNGAPAALPQACEGQHHHCRLLRTTRLTTHLTIRHPPLALALRTGQSFKSFRKSFRAPKHLPNGGVELVLPVDDYSVAGAVVAQRELILVADAAADERIDPTGMDADVRTVICIPIFASTLEGRGSRAVGAGGSGGSGGGGGGGGSTEHGKRRRPGRGFGGKEPPESSFKKSVASFKKGVSASFRKLRGRGARVGLEFETKTVLGSAAKAGEGGMAHVGVDAPRRGSQQPSRCIGCLQLINKRAQVPTAAQVAAGSAVVAVGGAQVGAGAAAAVPGATVNAADGAGPEWQNGPKIVGFSSKDAKACDQFFTALGISIACAHGFEQQALERAAAAGVTVEAARAKQSRAKSFKGRKARSKLKAAVLAHKAAR